MKNVIYLIFFVEITAACSEATFVGGRQAVLSRGYAPQIDGEQKREDGLAGLAKATADNVNACVPEVKALPNPSSAIRLNEMFHWIPAPGDANINSTVTPMVGPIVSNKPSIVFVAYGADSLVGEVVAIDAASGKQQWVSPISADGWRPVAIGDVDGDGKTDVVVGETTSMLYDQASGVLTPQGHVYVLNGADGSIKYMSKDFAKRPMGGPSISDDGNGGVVVTYGNLVFDGKTGSTIHKYRWEALPANFGSGGMALIADGGISGLRDQTGAYQCKFAAKIPDSKGVMANVFVELSNFSYAQMRPKDSFKTVYGYRGGSFARLFAFRSDTCAELFAIDVGSDIGGGGGPANIADFDGDGNMELGIAGRSFYATYGSDGVLKWKMPIDDASSGTTGSTAFDLNGDGKTEILYADEKNLFIFDGTTGGVIYQMPNTSGTVVENPIVVDVNGDGHAKIVITSNGGPTSGVRVLESPENDWVDTRSIWNQHAYTTSGVLDNGKPSTHIGSEAWVSSVKDVNMLGFRNNVAFRAATGTLPPNGGLCK
jgi:FG-GAP repeat